MEKADGRNKHCPLSANSCSKTDNRKKQFITDYQHIKQMAR